MDHHAAPRRAGSEDLNTPRDTIVAVATAAGIGGIGIVRLSGPRCPAILHGLGGRPGAAGTARLLRFHGDAGEIIDRGLCLSFPAPRSYTGEDVLELHAHGNRFVLERLVRRCVELGARRARPGEFTERAFLEGKLDLAQAEAVADLIAANSERAARAALRSLTGEFSTAINSLLEALIELRVHVEAAIDFPEEEIDFLGDGQIRRALTTLIARAQALLAQTCQGVRLRDGLHVVIVGPPNAGKSSLLNALAGDDRAIVSAFAGTTRDVIREAIEIDGIGMTLADTAGLRESSDDPLEHEGMRRTRAEGSRADLVLAVLEDGDSAAEAALCRELKHVERILVHNKIDLSGSAPGPSGSRDGLHLRVSVATGAGMAALRQALRSRAGGGESGGGFSARARHVDALESVAAHLDAALGELDAGAGELVAECLRLAQQRLGEITGRYSADELLGAIFSSFCIGK